MNENAIVIEANNERSTKINEEEPIDMTRAVRLGKVKKSSLAS